MDCNVYRQADWSTSDTHSVNTVFTKPLSTKKWWQTPLAPLDEVLDHITEKKVEAFPQSVKSIFRR